MTPLRYAVALRSGPEMASSEHRRPLARHPIVWGMLATAGLAGLALSACSSPSHPNRQPR